MKVLCKTFKSLLKPEYRRIYCFASIHRYIALPWKAVMLVKTMECIVIWDLCIHRLRRVTGKVNATPCCLGSAVG